MEVVHTAPVPHRAHRTSPAQVGEQQLELRHRSAEQLRRPPGRPRVGQTVEAQTSQPEGVPPRPGQRVGVGHLGQVGVERGVRAQHVRDVREQTAEHLQQAEGDRHVQRSQVGGGPGHAEHVLVDHGRAAQRDPAVHQPVPHRHHRDRAAGPHEVRHGTFRGRTVGPVLDHVLGHHPVLRGDQVQLQARRPRVDGDHGVGHLALGGRPTHRRRSRNTGPGAGVAGEHTRVGCMVMVRPRPSSCARAGRPLLPGPVGHRDRR